MTASLLELRGVREPCGRRAVVVQRRRGWRVPPACPAGRSGAVRLGGRGEVHSRSHQVSPDPALPGGRGKPGSRLIGDRYLEEDLMNVEISGVTRRFGRNLAVAAVDVETGPGVFGLLGPNGAGKTTLLRMMATVITPSAGTLRLLGPDPRSAGPRREIRRRLGYLPQNLGYYPGFTVEGFVQDFPLLKEMPPAPIPPAVAGSLERRDVGGDGRGE